MNLNEQDIVVALSEPLVSNLDPATADPRLPIYITCAIPAPDTTGKGMTQDLSYTGLSILSRNFNPGHLCGAILHIKFVNLKAFPIGIDHRGADALVQFRVDHIEEG